MAHLLLCASRAFWLVACPGKGHEMLFDAHTRALTALGGVARRGISDNMKTAVDRVRPGKAREVNQRFSTMCAHYLLDAEFCNVASGWETGVVGKNVQDSRRRIWLDARHQRFSSLEELNAWLGERCRALWSEVAHPEHKSFSVADVLELERAHLMPMPAPFDGYVQEFSRVSSTYLVTVARNHYSVPCELARQMVSTRLYPARVSSTHKVRSPTRPAGGSVLATRGPASGVHSKGRSKFDRRGHTTPHARLAALAEAIRAIACHLSKAELCTPSSTSRFSAGAAELAAGRWELPPQDGGQDRQAPGLARRAHSSLPVR